MGAASTDLKTVVGQLHRANQEEIHLGMLAIPKAQSDDVADFGKTMVNDHTKADVSVLEFAREKKVALPPMFEGRMGGERGDVAAAPPAQNETRGENARAHHEQMQKLAGASGAEFDREYVAMMVSAHQDTLNALKSIESTVQDNDAKDLVKNIRSTVESHLEKAQKLQKDLAEEKGAKAPASGSSRSTQPPATH